MNKRNRIYQLISNSEFFDPDYYLHEYGEILPKDVDPVEHFIKIGWKRELNPSRNFDMHAYLEMNPDVKKARLNPLVHYLQFGKNEQRKIFEVDQRSIDPNNNKLGKEHQQKNFTHYGGEWDLKVANLLPIIESLKTSEFNSTQIESFIDDYIELYLQLMNFRQKPLIRLAESIDHLFPDYGRIQKFFRKSVSLYSLIKNQGIKGCFKAANKKNQKFILSESPFTQDTDSPVTPGVPTILNQEVSKSLLHYFCSYPSQLPDIFIFPSINWNDQVCRARHLTEQLAENGHRIFYIQANFFQSPDPEVTQSSKNIYLVRIPHEDGVVPFRSNLSKDNIASFESSMIKIKNAFNINTAILLVGSPFWRKGVLRLHESFGWKLVYDHMDENLGGAKSNAFALADDQRLLEESDLIFVSSNLPYKKYRQVNRNTILIPNGTDFTLFHQSDQMADMGKLLTISHPIIGYWGEISTSIDTKLISNLANKYKEWNFVLVGPTTTANLSLFDGKSNIYIIGEQPNIQLHAYLNSFDVCILPYTKNDYTDAINLINLFEYLSVGKPVVAMRGNETSRFSRFVSLAETQEEWEIALKASLSEGKTSETLTKRFNFTESNTWQKRAETIEVEFKKLFPKISIIIVTYNNLKLTKLCLVSIQKNTEYPNYEVIVVDNASSDNTITYLDQYRETHGNILIIKNDKNLGFAVANNQGVKIASGDYIVFLNNDTIVTPGWLNNLLLHLIRNPGAGMVGPVTNAIGNEAKIDIDYAELRGINFFAARRSAGYTGISFKIKVLALYCSMISRDLFNRLGGLDEQFRVGMFEDDDLAMKINQAGLQLLCAEDVFIHHFHGASFNKIEDQELQRIFYENKLKFETKWGIKWQPHQNRK
jgi:GT2 family glycosyltransferase/glycosyltransferase involved in cell wall biosynthesis